METVKLGLLIKKTKVARCGEYSYPVLSITKQDGIIMQSEKFKLFVGSAVAHKPFDIEFFSKSTVQRFIKEV